MCLFGFILLDFNKLVSVFYLLKLLLSMVLVPKPLLSVPLESLWSHYHQLLLFDLLEPPLRHHLPPRTRIKTSLAKKDAN